MTDAPRLDRITALTLALILGLALAFLLHRAAWSGQLQSFDPALYARNLWGLAHGDLHNPIAQRHALTTHLHLILLPLAPLNLLLPAGIILIGAQAAALAATTWLLASRFASLAKTSLQSALYPLLAVALGLLGSPLVLNPFLFDARPETLALPFLLAGLLRAVDLGGFDRRALLTLLPALLVREEFGLVIAAALLTAPRTPDLSRRAAWGAAALGVAWWGAFQLAVFLSFPKAERVPDAAIAGLAEGNDLTALLAAKAALAALALTSGGLFALRGWRWAGAAIPGAVGLAISTWRPDSQLNFHYPLFLAPGLLAATWAGLRAWSHNEAARRPWHLPLALATAAAAFLLASAAPGGGSARPLFFDFDDGFLASDHDRDGSRDTHALLREHLPPDAGAALPWPYLLPHVDRAVIWTDTTLLQHIAQQQPHPKELRFVMLHQPDWPTADDLVHLDGFNLIGVTPRYALLSRDQPSPPELLLRFGQPPPHDSPSPIATWAERHLQLLDAQRLPNGCVAVTVFLQHPLGAPPEIHQRLQFSLYLSDEVPLIPLLAAKGLLRIADLPPGHTITLATVVPLPPDSKPSLLLAAGPDAAFAPDGAPKPLVPLRLP